MIHRMVTVVAHHERWTIWIVGGTTTTNTRIAIAIIAIRAVAVAHVARGGGERLERLRWSVMHVGGVAA